MSVSSHPHLYNGSFKFSGTNKENLCEEPNRRSVLTNNSFCFGVYYLTLRLWLLLFLLYGGVLTLNSPLSWQPFCMERDAAICLLCTTTWDIPDAWEYSYLMLEAAPWFTLTTLFLPFPTVSRLPPLTPAVSGQNWFHSFVFLLWPAHLCCSHSFTPYLPWFQFTHFSLLQLPECHGTLLKMIVFKTYWFVALWKLE